MYVREARGYLIRFTDNYWILKNDDAGSTQKPDSGVVKTFT